MANLSLRTRSLLLALAGILVIVPAIILAVERAYTGSLEQAKYDELKLMSLAMITEFEIDNGEAFMPQQLFEEQLNLPGSGYIGYIIWQDNVVWRSLSALDYDDPTIDVLPPVGSEILSTMSLNINQQQSANEPAFYYAFSAEYENRGTFERVSFLVFNEAFEFEQTRDMFITTLWQWLAVMSLGMLAILMFIIQRVLAPVNSIIDSIDAAEKGKIQGLSERYPPELESLKKSINQLLSSEAQQRIRYKNSLGDLAHSLKTPLAVIQGEPALPDTVKPPLEQINSIITRQLNRAVVTNTQRFEPVTLLPESQKLLNAMQKVHADKSLSISLDIPSDLTLKADPTDIMELCGNLFDNACKSANSEVIMSAQRFENSVHIAFDDDGSGLSETDAQAVLNRGKRLDTYTEGQGIGLAVVSDLIETYNGQLRIERSTLGGARFRIILPQN